MTGYRQSLGKWGESQAVRYLTERGYHILERNARTPYGEIDIVAKEGAVTVFVEVKTRRGTSFGWPEEAMTSKKRANLIAALQHCLQTHPELDGDSRVDVIAIPRLSPDAMPTIQHYENAFYG